MANGVFNIMKGTWRYFCTLPGFTDSLDFVLIKTGVQADDLLNNFDNLASLKSQNTEADFSNYSRKQLTSGVTITQDNTANTVSVDVADQTWGAASPTNALAKLIVCYRPASTSTDPDLIPMFYFDFVATTNGSDLIAQVNAAGLAGTT